MPATKHWSEFKKYRTSASFCGVAIFLKDDRVAGRCGCGWLYETEDGPTSDLIEKIAAHHSKGCAQ